MANKPFEIQSSDLVLGGVKLQAGTTGVVIPGITHASSYKVEEVNDRGDQTQQFTNGVDVAIDKVIYDAKVNNAGADVSGYAVYIVQLDDQNYIDSIEVDSRGSYTSVESATNESTDMWEYNGTDSDPIANFVQGDWVAVPFRPRMRAGAIVTEGGGGGTQLPSDALGYLHNDGNGTLVWQSAGSTGTTGSQLVNGDYTFTLNNNGTITLPPNVTFIAPNHDVSWQGSDWINIQGTSGYYSNYNDNSVSGGEGTGINIQAGLGGESNDFNHGGRGGQLDFHAGNGQHGANGGAVTIGAGAATWNDATNVRGGDINLTAGDATNQNQITSGRGTGGDLHLGAGRGNQAGGSVFVHTSDDHTGTNFTKLWEFDQNGQLNLPANSVGDSVIYSNTGNVELYTNKSNGTVKIRAKGTGGDNEWIFNNDGSITFPDTTVQTTAYTGQSTGGGSGANINNWLLDITTVNTSTGIVLSITAVEYDSLGNVLAVGLRQNNSTNALTLMKFDTHGNLIWQNLFGDSVNVDGFGLAVDNDNNAIISGQYDNKLFLLKVDGTNGNGIWGTSLAGAATGTNYTSGLTVDVDSHNDIIAVGYVSTSDYNDDLVVAKFSNVDGTNIWARKLGDEYFDQDAYGLGVGSLNQNEIVVVGYNEHYTGGTVTGVTDVSPASNPAWTGTDITVVSPNNSNHGLNITVSFTDGVPSFTVVDGAIGHSTGDSWSIDGAILGGATGTDDMSFHVSVDQAYIQDSQALVAKYDTDGVLQWQKEISVAGNYCSASDADIDSNGNIYVNASYGFDNTSTWGVVMSLSPVGDMQWSRQIGLGYCFAGSSSIVVGTDNLIYIGGMSTTGSVNNITDTNIYVGAYDEAGTVQWQRQFGNPNRAEFVGELFGPGGLASNFDIHGDYLVFGGGSFNSFLRDGGGPQDSRGFIFQMDKSGAEQYWGSTSLTPSYLPETVSTLTVTTSSLPDVAWTVTQEVAEPPYNPDDILITTTLGSLGATNGSSELVNGLKILKLETNGTITPPTVSGNRTLQVNGSVDVERPVAGWSVTQNSQSGNVWGTSSDVDPGGNIYIAGGWYDWDWDGDDRPLVIKYNAAGEKQWASTFLYDGSHFGGSSYNIEYDETNNQVVVSFVDWYNHNRVQVVRLNKANGSVVSADEISEATNHRYRARGLAMSSTGTWITAGEVQNAVSLTTGTLVGLTGSTNGILVLPRSYFSTWGQYPTSQNNWYIKTTYDANNASEDFVYWVNRYYSVPAFDLIGTGANFALDIEYSVETGEINYETINTIGTGYNPGDILVVNGVFLGSTGNTPVISDVGAALSVDGGVSVITPTSANIDWAAVANNVGSGTWRAVIYNDGANIEATITTSTYDIVAQTTVLTLDQDYSGSLTTATSNIAVYDQAGNCLVYVITAVDTNNSNAVQNYNRFGLVHSDTVKLDCSNGTDYGAQYQQSFVSYPGNDGSPTNIITTTKSSYPRWNDVQTDGSWTATDGTSTVAIIGSADYNDGYITWNLDGNLGGQGTPVTIQSTIEQYQPYYTTNDDAGILASNGVELTWGTANEDQRFNVVEYGSDGSIYAAGYGRDNTDLGYCSLVVKFNSAGTAVLWHKLFQGTNSRDDYDIHGLEVVMENGTEYAYAITYDDSSNGMLYKLNASTGNIEWCRYVLGGATGNKYWDYGAAVRVASTGEIVVAGISYNYLNAGNSSSLTIIRLNPDGTFISAREIFNTTGNDMRSRYEGDESDFQFELHAVTTGRVTTEYFVASLYTYIGNNSVSFTLRVPLVETVLSYPVGNFATYDISSAISPAVYLTTDYQTTTYSNAIINHGTLTKAVNTVITRENPYFGTNTSTVISLFGGLGGQIAGVRQLTFEDGTSQSSAYNPLMQSVVNTDYWYYVKAEDAGKFLYCDGSTYGIELPDDAARNLPIGWAMTIIAPIGRDIQIVPWYNNYPATLVVPGNDPQTNPNSNYNGWYLRGGGMATVLKVASNTYYISGGKLEAQ